MAEARSFNFLHADNAEMGGEKMSDYDQAWAATVGQKSEKDPYDAIMADVMPKPAAQPAQQQKAQPAPTKDRGLAGDLLDGTNAIATGFHRGLAHLAGLPVDTVANVIDLGKAAIGAPYTAITGKPAPDALQIGDRKNVVGSGQWIIENARKAKAGQVMLDAANPEYQGGYLQTAGAALTGINRPQTTAQAVNQTINSTASALAGKAAYDLTGNDALAITAGMSPSFAQNVATGTLKRVVRGGEEGRRQMEQRIQDLKAAGIDNPTMGLASGNAAIGGLENILQNAPGAVKRMKDARDGIVNGMQNRLNSAADAASPNRGSLEAGQAIQGGIKSFRDNFKAQQEALYNNLDNFIPAQTPVNVSNTKATLSNLNSDIPGAPELSRQFKNSRIQAIEQAINSDTTGSPATVMVVPQRPKAGGGIMNAPIDQPPLLVNIPEGPSRNTLPFEAVKKTRTLVGNEIADTNLASSVPRSKWNPLYGALAEDMLGAAQAAGPQAEQAYNRANNYTRAGIARLDRVQPFANNDAPERAFQLLDRTLGDNVSTLQAVKKTLPEDARGTIAGTVIEKLGKARPGQQNANGDEWSPDTFLTNWNRMKPEARNELFSGFKNAEQVKRNVESVAKATSMMRDNSKLWANPSGTAANIAARGTIGAVGGGGAAALLGMVSPTVPLLAAGTLGGTNLLARGLTNKKYVNAMAQKTYLDPELLDAQVRSLVGSGLLDQRN